VITGPQSRSTDLTIALWGKDYIEILQLASVNQVLVFKQKRYQQGVLDPSTYLSLKLSNASLINVWELDCHYVHISTC
jgi:hypothetical protein